MGWEKRKGKGNIGSGKSLFQIGVKRKEGKISAQFHTLIMYTFGDSNAIHVRHFWNRVRIRQGACIISVWGCAEIFLKTVQKVFLPSYMALIFLKDWVQDGVKTNYIDQVMMLCAMVYDTVLLFHSPISEASFLDSCQSIDILL